MDEEVEVVQEHRERSLSGSSASWSIVDEDEEAEEGLEAANTESDEEAVPDSAQMEPHGPDHPPPDPQLEVEGSNTSSILSSSTTTAVDDDGNNDLATSTSSSLSQLDMLSLGSLSTSTTASNPEYGGDFQHNFHQHHLLGVNEDDDLPSLPHSNSNQDEVEAEHPLETESESELEEEDEEEQDGDDDASTTTTVTEVEEEEDEDLCVVDEQEILEENSGAKHFIEPARVTRTLDQLSKKGEPLIHRLFDIILGEEETGGGADGHGNEKGPVKPEEGKSKVVNWILISLIVSAFGSVAIYQILERSWTRGLGPHTDSSHPILIPQGTSQMENNQPMAGDSFQAGEPLYFPDIKEAAFVESAEEREVEPERVGLQSRLSKGSHVSFISTTSSEKPKIEEKAEERLAVPARPLPSYFSSTYSSRLKKPRSTSPVFSVRKGRRITKEEYMRDFNARHNKKMGVGQEPVDYPEYTCYIGKKEQTAGQKAREKWEKNVQTPEKLHQCHQELHEAKSAFASKDKILHYVRHKELEQELLVQHLRTQLAEAERKLANMEINSKHKNPKIIDINNKEDESKKRKWHDSTPGAPMCLSEHTEQVLANLTKSFKERTSHFLNSFANSTTSLSKFVSREFSVKSLTKMSSWLRNQTRRINEQPFVQKTQEQLRQAFHSSWEHILPRMGIFKTVPKLMDCILHENWQDHMQTIVSSVSTALAPIFDHNFSLNNFDAEEGDEEEAHFHSSSLPNPPNEPIFSSVCDLKAYSSKIQGGGNEMNRSSSAANANANTNTNSSTHQLQVVWTEEDLIARYRPARAPRRAKPKKGLTPPPLPSPPRPSISHSFLCETSFQLAEALRASEVFARAVGIKEAGKYIGYLVNLPKKQCHSDSTLLRCERLWWTGALHHHHQHKNCPTLRWWQREKRIGLQDLLVSSESHVVQALVGLGWVDSSRINLQIDVQSGSRSKDVWAEAIELPSDEPVPPPPSSRLEKSSVKEVKGEVEPSSSPSEEMEEVEESPSPTEDWLLERSNWRQAMRQRRKQQLQLLEEDQRNWLLSRAKHRQELRREKTSRSSSSTSTEEDGDNQKDHLNVRLHRRTPTPYAIKWKKQWKAQADWLLLRAKHRANLRHPSTTTSTARDSDYFSGEDEED